VAKRIAYECDARAARQRLGDSVAQPPGAGAPLEGVERQPALESKTTK